MSHLVLVHSPELFFGLPLLHLEAGSAPSLLTSLSSTILVTFIKGRKYRVRKENEVLRSKKGRR
jgi:hypothetical protein